MSKYSPNCAEIIPACASCSGSERLLESAALDGRRVGVVCNPASVDARVPSTSPIGSRRDARAAARRHLRPAARVPIRRPGEHDRDRPRRDDDPPRAGVLALQRDARADRRRCCEDLDVLVIDLQDVGTRIYTYIYTMANCLTRRAPARREGHRLRSARIRSAASRSKDRCSIAGFESFVGLYPIPDAARDDDRRARAAVQRALRHRRRSRGRRRWRAGARRMYHDDDRRAVGDALAEHPDARQSRSSIRARCSSKARTCRKDAARRGRSSCVGAPWVSPRALRRRAERARSCPGVFFRPALFEPTFHKHAKASCGGCQIHVIDRETFRPVAHGRRARSPRSARADPDGSAGASRRTNTSGQAAVRHPGRVGRAARADRGG